MKKLLAVLLVSSALASLAQAESAPMASTQAGTEQMAASAAMPSDAGTSGQASASAPMTTTRTSPFNGFYAGLSVGYARTLSDVDFAQGTTTISKVDNLSANSGLVDVFAGYGITTCGCLYVGGELLVGYNPASLKAKNNFLGKQLGISDNSTFKRDGFFWGAAARIGYVFNPSGLVYLRLGTESVKYKVAGDYSTKFSDTSKTAFVFTPGLGIEYMVAKKVGLRAEYIYTWRREMAFATNPAVVGAANGGNVNINPAQHAFKLGLSYHF